MNSSLIHSITEMNLKRYGLITKILSAKKTYRLKFPIVDACVPASLSHVYICSQHLIYVYVGFFFFQKNLVTLICCYLLLSGGLNKWLLHLNAGKMRNKPDYTNQKQRYHSWLQRYSLGNWLVQGPRECLNDSEWNTLIGLFVDNLVAHDDTQRHVHVLWKILNLHFLFLLRWVGQRPFVWLSLKQNLFIGLHGQEGRRGGGVERARWRLGSSPSKPQETYVMHFQYKKICISRTSLTGLICLYFLCP